MTKAQTGSGEFELIARHFAPLAWEPGAFGLSDDAAVLTIPDGRQLVVTTDTIVEQVHFLSDDPAFSVAGKVLGVNLSDLAAMGARPLGYVLGVALPRSWTAARREDWLTGFAAGLEAMQRRFALPLVGGDTVATQGPLTLSVTAFGTVLPGAALRRSKARPGDRILVSGTIGDALLGLELLQGRHGLPDGIDGTPLIERYRCPQPRVALGEALADCPGVHAAIDISDGLIADLGHIALTSGLAATIVAERVPLSAAAQAFADRWPDERSRLLSGGDDYEILFTADAAALPALAEIAAALAVPLTPIGVMSLADDAEQAGTVRLVDRSGRPQPHRTPGYRHF